MNLSFSREEKSSSKNITPSHVKVINLLFFQSVNARCWGSEEIKENLNNARISSRKVKIVLDLIKGKDLAEAYAIVRFTPKAASELIYKLLHSAEANAVNNFDLDSEKLYVADCYANQGPTLKRMRAVARGRGTRINKRTSHITVVLKERD